MMVFRKEKCRWTKPIRTFKRMDKTMLKENTAYRIRIKTYGPKVYKNNSKICRGPQTIIMVSVVLVSAKFALFHSQFSPCSLLYVNSIFG